MGAKSAEIEREIVEKRQVIAEKMERLEGRLRADVQGVQSTVNDRISHISERLDRSSLVEYVREHPFSSLAGGLGVGVLTGVISESVTFSEGESRREPERRPDRGEGFIDRFSGAVMGTVIGSVQEVVGRFIKETFGGFREREGEQRERRAA